MMAGGEGDVTRTSGQEAVVATDQASGRILFHQRSDMDSNTFPIDLFQHDQVGRRRVSHVRGDTFVCDGRSVSPAS